MEHPNFPKHLVEELPIEAALEAIGFVRNKWGCLSRKWGIVEFDAGPWIIGWMLTRSYIKPGVIGWPYEIRIPESIAPVALLGTLYRLWKDAYPMDDPPDALLLWGKEYLDHQRHERELKTLIPPMPTLWTDREFLRHCFTYIERLHDWTDQDYEIRFSQVPGQVKISVGTTEVYCPARGNWLGEAIVSAKEFFRHIPKRFVGNMVTLQTRGDKILVASSLINARWIASARRRWQDPILPDGFDEDTYARAKPHFEAALKSFIEAGKTLKDLFKMLFEEFGEGIKPYAVRFAKDRRLSTKGTLKGEPDDRLSDDREGGAEGPQSQRVPQTDEERGAEGVAGPDTGGLRRDGAKPGEGGGPQPPGGLPRGCRRTSGRRRWPASS